MVDRGQDSIDHHNQHHLSENIITNNSDQPMDIQANIKETQDVVTGKENMINGIKAYRTPISYKDSLIRYNGCFGINKARDTNYINDTLAKELEQEWLPTETTKKLMERFPLVLISDQE